jgi:hypothetical protein
VGFTPEFIRRILKKPAVFSLQCAAENSVGQSPFKCLTGLSFVQPKR